MTKQYKPDLSNLIVRAKARSGMTWEGLANRIEQISGEPVHLATLFRIQSGETQNPSYNLGKAIEWIHKHSGKR